MRWGGKLPHTAGISGTHTSSPPRKASKQAYKAPWPSHSRWEPALSLAATKGSSWLAGLRLVKIPGDRRREIRPLAAARSFQIGVPPALQQLHGSTRADIAQLFPKTPGCQDFDCFLIRVRPRNPHAKGKLCLKLAHLMNIWLPRLIPRRFHEGKADSERPWLFKAEKIVMTVEI